MTWRRGTLILIPLAVTAGIFSMPAIPQDLGYHMFADTRPFLGIPNFGNVISNGAFLISGLLGLSFLFRDRDTNMRLAWWAFFTGVLLVTLGSGYYHWQPADETLVWDRLTMTIAFSAATAAFIADYVKKQLEKPLLIFLLPVGMASVIYWHLTNDLRVYFVVQGTVFLTLLAVLALFVKSGPDRKYVLLALGCYVLAFLSEQTDARIFELTNGVVSGHTIKHLFAGLAPYWLYRMLTRSSTV